MIFNKNRWTSIVGTAGSIMSPTAIQYQISKIKSENAIGLIKPVLLECCSLPWYSPYLLCDLYSFDIFTLIIFLRDLLFSETLIEMLKFKKIPRSITLNLCQINSICSSVNLYSKLTFLRIASNFLGSSRYRGIFGNALYPSPGWWFEVLLSSNAFFLFSLIYWLTFSAGNMQM